MQVPWRRHMLRASLRRGESRAMHPFGGRSEHHHELTRLLALSAAGDRSAFQTFYRLTSPPLLGVVSHILGGHARAEDVLRDAYVIAWSTAASSEAARDQPMNWLTSIARDLAVDSLRSPQSRPQTRPADQASTLEEAVNAPIPDHGAIEDAAVCPFERLSRTADARALHVGIGQLSAPQRRSLALAFFGGLSHREVAASMRQPLGSVKSWIRLGLRQLKAGSRMA